MICPKCGAQNEPGSEFCDQCGTPLSGKKKRSRLPLVLVMLFLILALAGTAAVWILTDEHHTLAEAREDYDSAKASLEEAEQKEKALKEAEEEEKISGNKKEQSEKTEDKDQENTDKDDAEADDAGKDKDGEEKDKTEDDYILPESNTRYLTDADVDGLSLREINYAKNEIYARHGRKFDSQELQDYFNSKSWYTGKYDPADFDKNYSGTLNDYEKKNAEFLREKEFSISPDGYKLDAD